MVGQWAQIRAIHHALVADKDLPPTKEEAEAKKTNWAKMAKARAQREEHDHEFLQALTSPKHFGRFLGMEAVLGAPPPETVKTAEEIKQQEVERLSNLEEETKAYFLEHSILARAAKAGKNFKKRGV